ncbi:MAG: hypothetical protein Q4D85_13150 [Corynebacterium sp.]|uniref:hypothetical protein n=1 Tax=Corynebacterium sp. TaxID=1720 RepID=UPI0026DCB483|nr:hypothetical protein [Corynebacterium sp.]MDO5099681.1 hypothetical protein [Corynebacterium sp.]
MKMSRFACGLVTAAALSFTTLTPPAHAEQSQPVTVTHTAGSSVVDGITTAYDKVMETAIMSAEWLGNFGPIGKWLGQVQLAMRWLGRTAVISTLNSSEHNSSQLSSQR